MALVLDNLDRYQSILAGLARSYWSQALPTCESSTATPYSAHSTRKVIRSIRSHRSLSDNYQLMISLIACEY